MNNGVPDQINQNVCGFAVSDGEVKLTPHHSCEPSNIVAHDEIIRSPVIENEFKSETISCEVYTNEQARGSSPIKSKVPENDCKDGGVCQKDEIKVEDFKCHDISVNVVVLDSKNVLEKYSKQLNHQETENIPCRQGSSLVVSVDKSGADGVKQLPEVQQKSVNEKHFVNNVALDSIYSRGDISIVYSRTLSKSLLENDDCTITGCTVQSKDFGQWNCIKKSNDVTKSVGDHHYHHDVMSKSDGCNLEVERSHSTVTILDDEEIEPFQSPSSEEFTKFNTLLIEENPSPGLSSDNNEDNDVQCVDVQDNGQVTGKGGTGKAPSNDGRSARQKPVGICQVCRFPASGKYFGALVCVPCKTFFLRYANDGYGFRCKHGGTCDINVSTRIQCKSCRFRKCLQANMQRKVRPLHVIAREGRQLCKVCGDHGNGVHFGTITCEGCKKFFRRGLEEHESYVCKKDQKCVINPSTRNGCRFCRYKKCLEKGMSRDAIQMGRPSKQTYSTSKRSDKRDATEFTMSNLKGSKNPNAAGAYPERQDCYTNYSWNSDRDAYSDEVIDLSMSSNKSSASDDARRQPAVSRSFSDLSFFPVLSCDVASVGYSHPAVVPNGFQIQNSGLVNFVSIPSVPQPDSTVSSSVESLECSSISQKIKLKRFRPSATERNPAFLSEEIPPVVTVLDVQEGLSIPSNDGSGRSVQINGMDTSGRKYSASESAVQVHTSVQQQQLNSFRKTDAAGPVPLKRRYLENLPSNRGACSSPSVSSSVEIASKSPVIKIEDSDEDSNGSFTAKTYSAEEIVMLCRKSEQYWIMQSLLIQEPCSPFDLENWPMIVGKLTTNYNEFVSFGETANINLRENFRKWRLEKENRGLGIQDISDWIKQNVIPCFTMLSVTYFRGILGFDLIGIHDQKVLLQYGQSASRLLVAAVHWYDEDANDFGSFLSWREQLPQSRDKFKQAAIAVAKKIKLLNLNLTEEVLINALLVMSTDIPDIKKPKMLEGVRSFIVSAFHLYLQNERGSGWRDRLSEVCVVMPELRKLGYLHHEMTHTQTMMAEELPKLNL